MTRPRGAAKGARATAFRIPADVLSRVDVYAERLRAENPWMNAGRSDAVRALLVHALDSLKVPPAPRRQRKGTTG